MRELWEASDEHCDRPRMHLFTEGLLKVTIVGGHRVSG